MLPNNVDPDHYVVSDLDLHCLTLLRVSRPGGVCLSSEGPFCLFVSLLSRSSYYKFQIRF